MQLKDIKKEGIFTTLYYELTWKIGWEQLLSILDVVIRHRFSRKGIPIPCGGYDRRNNSTGCHQGRSGKRRRHQTVCFCQRGIRLCSVDRLFASHESYNADHRLEPERPLYTSIADDRAIDKDGKHSYDKYADSIEILAHIDYAKKQPAAVF